MVELYPTPANFSTSYTPHHISLVEEQTIARLEKLVHHLYPEELACLPIQTVPRSLINETDYRRSDSRRL